MKFNLQKHLREGFEERWDKNPESTPQAYGLTLVARMDYSKESYSFDYRLVWVDESGRLWTARDSGCSCPTPFDPDTLKELDRLYSVTDLIDEMWGALKDSRDADRGGFRRPSWREWGKFVHDVEVAQGKA